MTDSRAADYHSTYHDAGAFTDDEDDDESRDELDPGVPLGQSNPVNHVSAPSQSDGATPASSPDGMGGSASSAGSVGGAGGAGGVGGRRGEGSGKGGQEGHHGEGESEGGAPESSPPLTPPRFAFGDLVEVESRTWPGINKPGGVGRVQGVNRDTGTIDVKYVVNGGSENDINAKYVSLHVLDVLDSVEGGSGGSGGARSSKRRSIRRRSAPPSSPSPSGDYLSDAALGDLGGDISAIDFEKLGRAGRAEGRARQRHKGGN